MPRARRTRTVQAPPEAVWRVVGDPSHQARWWPKVTRVEGVHGDAFTRVYETGQGRPVRADFRVVSADPPRRREWEQVIEGTPFERVLRTSVETAELEPDGEATRLTLEVHQTLRGISKLGGFLVKRAARTQLDQALDGLEQVL